VFRRSTQQTFQNDEQRNTLSQLLVSEEQAATRLEQTREEAARILADAAAYDLEVQSGCVQLIDERIRALRIQRETELDAELETIRVNAEQEIATFTGVAPQRMAELVDGVLATLITIDDAPRSDRS
jgi:hypothetical protein